MKAMIQLSVLLSLMVSCAAGASGQPPAARSPQHNLPPDWFADAQTACVTPGCVDYTLRQPSCYPRFYAEVDALLLNRDNRATDQPVVLNNITLDTILTTRDLAFDTEVGPRLLAGIELCPCTAFEGSYFGIYGWDSSKLALGDDDLRIPGDIALATLDFLDADAIRLDYTSELNSVEINAVRTSRKGSAQRDLLLGARYVRFTEEFNINATDLDTGTSDYNIRARNNLFGAQVGVRLRDQSCRWSWNAMAKAGLYGNAATQSTYLGDFDNSFVFRDLSVSNGQASFVGEINLNLEYRLNCACRIRAGYNLLWIEGVALGPDQLDFTDTPESSNFISTAGGVFFHGANMGFVASW